ncbi:uncharacterized protein LOC134194858 [Corticium candelabrum]|uniref:uncharacterized protein LOC134194858 n=1 Tax=Corticium candelabrum TaxID=121492 RepID=UPI002E2562BA|nr:uncharacterized protein LOC134194858 [Corticium candelabrum]
MDRPVSSSSFSPLNTLIQVNKDTIVEALAFDATLAEFFNAFLQLPVFPRAMAYNVKRRVIEEEAGSEMAACKSPGTCGNVMKWVRDNRAELFLRSSLFSEYKLCILLTRSGAGHWDTFESCSEGSSICNIKALRDMQTALQTPEYGHDVRNVDAASLEVACNSTSISEQRAKSEDLRHRASQEINLAKTSNLLGATSGISLRQITVLSAPVKRSLQSRQQAPSSVTISTFEEKESKASKTEHSDSSLGGLHSRVVSAKIEKDGEYIFGERLTFDERDLGEFAYDSDDSDNGDDGIEGGGDSDDGDDDVEDEEEDKENTDKQTEVDLIDLESKTGKNFSQMMADALSSVAGMINFKTFLLGKVGYSMLNAWLDIDKVTGSAVITLTNKQLRRSLRQLAEKYSGTVVGNRALGWLRKYHRRRSEINPLIQIQISILRRLHNYWCPRFIVHTNRSRHSVSSACNVRLTVKSTPSFCRSLSLSLEKTRHLVLTVNEKCELLPLKERIQSARVVTEAPRPYCQLVTAIQCDVDAGEPFAAFLLRSNDDKLRNTLLFLQSLWQLASCLTLWQGTLSVRLSSAWNLWNTYLKDDGSHPIAVERDAKQTLCHILGGCKGYVSVDHFQDVECAAVDVLRLVWVEYLQHDDNIYISQCYPKPEPEVSTSSHTSPQSQFIDTQPKDLHESSRLLKRKKVRRSKRTSNQQNSTISESKNDGDGLVNDGVDGRKDSKGAKVAETEQKSLNFVNLARNEMVVSAFKDFLLHYGDPVALNRLLLWLDIQEIILVHKTSSRTPLSIQAHKNYFYEKSKRSVDLPDAFKDDLNVKSTSHRPSTGMLTTVQAHFVPFIQSKFEEFLQSLVVQSDQTIESLPALQILLQKRKKNKKISGRGIPTHELQDELSTILVNAEGPWPHKLSSFRSYLKYFGPSDGYPLSENNLSFWIEVQKLKDMFQGSADKVFVKRKANVVADCYLDCSNPPWLQVDLPADFAHRLLNNMRGSQPHHVAKSTPRSLNLQLLNEAQAQVLKELVPFWAGFVKRYKLPGDGDETEQKFKSKKGRHHKRIGRKNSTMNRRTKSECDVENAIPSIVHCSLPPLPTPVSRAVCRHLTFSLAMGAHWKASQDAVCEASSL